MLLRSALPATLGLLLVTGCAPASKPEAAPARAKPQAVLSPVLSQNFEAGLGGWTATTTSGTGTWQVRTNPQTFSVSSALNPFVVTLADTGAHLPAAGGTNVAWFGDATGTFIGNNYPAQSAKNGGTSAAVQTGTLVSPSFSLAGASKAQLEFDSWWEIEGTAAASYDLCQVWVSNNGGAFVMVGQLNPTFALQQPAEAAYSSGGPAAAPVWRHYSYDLSAYAGSSNVRVQFRFDSRDQSYNAFRGFTVDNVLISGGSSLNPPAIAAVSPSIATTNDLVTISGSGFVQGAVFSIGATNLAANAITQFGANEVIFKMPAFAAGTYAVKVTNPDGQTFTLPNALAFSSTASPTVTAVSPNSASVGTPKSVTISGTNFQAGATVTFGEAAATGVTIGSATSLTATAPALASGTWNVTVTNPTGQSGTKFAAFTVSDTSTITLTSPNGGQSWAAGSVQNLTWSSSGLSVISADLYKGGVFVSTIAASVPAAPGTWAWTLPAGLAAGTDYKVKLFNPLGTVSVLSAGNFTISAAAIATTTTVSSSIDSSAEGQAVTFTAAISPAATGGTVQFSIDGVAFGGPVPVSAGLASSGAISTLTGGAHTITASYSGAAPYVGSSGSMTQHVNRSPVAQAQALSTQENVSKAFTLAAADPDEDPLTWVVVSGPAHGALTGTAPDLTYAPAPGYFGADAITFKVNDGRADSNVATISLTVDEVNVAPVASSQVVSLSEDGSASVPLVATDGDGDALTWTIITPPSHGSLSGTAPGLVYTPEANYAGPDGFTFKVNDGALDSNLAAVTLSIAAVNDAPVAAGQSLSTAEDTASAIELTAADVDVDPLTFQVVAGPSHGTLSGAAPNLVYTPAAGFHGPDAFTFRVADGEAQSNVATIALTVTAVNDPPTAHAQSIASEEDAAATVTLGGHDVDGDSLSFVIVSPPAHGTLVGTPPNLSYQPFTDFHGADAFTFKVSDGALESEPATISLAVSAVNDAPVATSQTLATAEDVALVIALGGTDLEGGALSFVIVTGPSHGTLSGTAPNLSYQPAADYHGADSFTFRVSDGAASSAEASIELTISPVDDAPLAQGQAQSTEEDTAVALSLSGSDVDGDTLTWVIVSAPAHGTLEGSAPNLTYRPAADFHGADAFTFKVNDGSADSSVASVQLTVTSVNDAPVAQAQSVASQEDTAASVTLVATDVDADSLTFAVITPPAHGTLVGTAPHLTYQPAADYHGADSFTFQANDGTESTSPVTVTLTISAVNDAPVAHAQTITTAEDTARAVTLAGSDVDGDALTFAVVTAPAHGTLSGAAPNLTWTPAPGYHGADSFTFRVGDGALDSEPVVISLTVDSVNDAPVANAQALTTAEDTALELVLTGSDADGDQLTYQVVTGPAHGGLIVTGQGVTYVPAADFHGADVFTFVANDGQTDSSPASIEVQVTSANDAPVAASASVSVDEDGTTAITLTGTDVDGDPLSFSVVAQPAHGTLTGTGSQLSYQPAPDFHGDDTLTFSASDGALSSLPVSISITVSPINDAPVARALAIDAEEDEGTPITLAGTDVDLDTLTFTVDSPPQHGTLTGAAPELVYTPHANYAGPDAFTFRVSDGQTGSAPAEVSIEVGPINDVPVAAAQLRTTPEDVALAITLGGTDEEGAPLTFTVVRAPAHGQLSGTGAELRYQPAADFHGEDEFSFVANDGQAESAAARVRVSVQPVNDAPVASALSQGTPEDTAVELTLTGTDVDGDALTYAVVAGPAHGVLSGTGSALRYTPDPDFHGLDTFSFEVNDGTVDSASAQVTLDVGSRNDAPVANAAALTTAEDVPVQVTLTASDRDQDALSFVVITQPLHGTLTGTPPNLSYAPHANAFGADSFTFKVNDGQADSNVATVSLTVRAVDDLPVAEALELSLRQSTATELELRGSDVEGAALTFTLLSSPLHGTLTGEAPKLVYKPDPAHSGADSFSYRVSADGADSAAASVSITVIASQDTLVGGGVGCSATGSSMPWALLGLAVLLRVLRRRHAAVAGAAGLIVSVTAQAQTTLPAVDVESLRLNPAATQSLVAETGAMMAPQTVRFAVTGHYEYEPLVLFRDGERLGGLVKDRFTTHLAAAWAPLSWLEVAAQVPIVLMQRSDDLSAYGYARPASTALGTSLLQARVGLLQQRHGAPIDLAISLGLDLPLGSDAALSREAGFGALPRVGVGRTLFPWLRVGAEAGVMLRPAASFQGDPIGRTALQSAVLVETVGSSLRGELTWRASIPLSGAAAGTELLAGGRYAITPWLEVYALGGVGLGRGLGTPAFRIASGLAFSLPVSRSADGSAAIPPVPARAARAD